MLKKYLLLLLLCTCHGALFADQMRLSAANDNNGNPDEVYGVMASYVHQPENWQWSNQQTWFNKLQVGMAYTLATWETGSPNRRSAKAKKNLHTFAFSPMATVSLYNGQRLKPYATLAIGPALLSTSQFGSQHLGSHACFQDLVGLGTRIGSQWDASINYLHYSNAGLAKHNQGVDIHWMLSIGYHEATP